MQPTVAQEENARMQQGKAPINNVQQQNGVQQPQRRGLGEVNNSNAMVPGAQRLVQIRSQVRIILIFL